MPNLVIWLITLSTIAALLYAAEVFIPSHGVLSILATGCLVVVIGLCFVLNRWLGAGVMVALALLGPVGVSLGVSLWQKTPVGKKMVLTTTAPEPPRPFVLVGSRGITLTELRPMGECEFDDTRIEARSELNTIVASGVPVVVIALADGIATVRSITESNQFTSLQPKELVS